MKTTFPTNTCASFNEWSVYIRQCMNEYRMSNEQQKQNNLHETPKVNEQHKIEQKGIE